MQHSLLTKLTDDDDDKANLNIFEWSVSREKWD